MAEAQSALAASETIETRKKRLRYRSAHRGMKESDLLLGSFADTHLGDFNAGQLDRFEALLEESDKDLMDWIYRRCPPPAEKTSDVLALLLAYRYPGAC